jgi:glycosyltransferase involved in cell wall biosynthesis
MRILVLHSRYASGDASGENQVVDDEARLLADAGHDVQTWSPEPDTNGPLRLLATGAGAIHSPSAARVVRDLLREQRSEIVHCHNLFPGLSPSVLRVVAGAGAGVVLTLHNYRLLCLPATFLREGRVCEDCLGRLPWRGVVHRCYRGSLPGSGALAGSLALHRAARTFRHVHRFLAVSAFVRDKYVQAGFPGERIVVKPNFVPARPVRHGRGRYLLFLGRLSPEKGAATLLEAHRPAEHGRLVIAGDGPERARLEARARDGVEFLGAVSPDEVPALLADAQALLVPSLSYEGAPRAVVEAYAAGVPVVASRIGALCELVHDGSSGLLVPADDTDCWAEAMSAVANGDNSELGRGARRLWEAHYSPERAVSHLERAYRAALRETQEVSEA